VRTKEFRSWKEFVAKGLDRFNDLPAGRRNEYWFRGQADARWPLQASLDRKRKFVSQEERTKYAERLLDAFQKHVMGLDIGRDPRSVSKDEWELLARHHGLPTTILDWSRSPFVASYFAFAEEPSKEAKAVAVWALDTAVFTDKSIPQLAIIEEEQAIWFNPRAVEQRGLFLRVVDATADLPELMGDYLVKMVIPVGERRHAITALDDMLVNERTLFRDLDGAAKAAAARVLVIEG
jgi:hypothetical protein